MQKPASRGQSLSGQTGRGMAQYANTRGLNNYNYVDGQHLCVLLKCFPSLKSKIFLSIGTVRECPRALIQTGLTLMMRTPKDLTPTQVLRQDHSSKLQIM